MNKKVKIGLITVVLLIGGATIIYFTKNETSTENKAQSENSHQQTAGHDTKNSQTEGMHTENDGHANHEPAKEVTDLTNQTEVQMDIKDFAYSKSNIRIRKGTIVTWTNLDNIQHNVMLEHEGSNQAHDPPTKEEVDPNELAGQLLSKGESYSFTFKQSSENAYHCSPHPFMKGRIEVVE